MKKTVLINIFFSYMTRRILPLGDLFEVTSKKLKERFFGFDYSIFEKTISYYAEVKGESISKEDALAKALNKAEHKKAWHESDRNTIEDKQHFYQEAQIYPFRQPLNKRFGGFRWYRRLVNHISRPSILEYGCGSAVLTEYLVTHFPDVHFTVADIPSVTLDFVKWKKHKYMYPYEILTIGIGKEGIPLRKLYDLIICQDVLEHTPNPLDIVESFVTHLSLDGVLLVDFINAPGGENLKEAVAQREAVKDYLQRNLIAIKAIDVPRGNAGVYVKNM
jgi:2-polyprenyl-3-methyl-5-hydroxy-6-metoxy-1,4-benzoquinol methylase